MIDSLISSAQWNVVTIVLGLIMLISVWQGVGRGASGSMRHLLFMLIESGITVLSIIIAYKLSAAWSPELALWLQGLNIQIPNHELAWWEKGYYTFVFSLRDISILRFTLLMLILYLTIRTCAGWLSGLMYAWTGMINGSEPRARKVHSMFHLTMSRMTGAAVGAFTGMIRVIMVVILLFGYVNLLPNNQIGRMIQSSHVYQLTVNHFVEPIAGEWMSKQLPVFTAQVEHQLSELMQRRYEVIDHRIPADIGQAAAEITKGAKTNEEKARKLYDWVGSRVQYDWDKANAYMDRGEWNEQNPQDTFVTRKGVCIDYSRLYAVMARAVDLEVRVVTGLGYDGRGGYGPHAWNTVLIEGDQWIPLDATWANGGNWFNPPNFDETHIPDQKQI